MLCYGQGKKEVNRSHLGGAINDTDGVTVAPTLGREHMLIIATACIGVCAAVAWWVWLGAKS
jgi:hypothetical protein